MGFRVAVRGGLSVGVDRYHLVAPAKRCQTLVLELSEWKQQCSNCRGGLGGLTRAPPPPPLPHLADPPTSGQNSTPGGPVSTPHLSFAEVGMLLPSHFLLMKFLKYLQCDDLNVTTILIRIED